jgi:hypothetical protein
MKFSQNVFTPHPAQPPKHKLPRGKKTSGWTGEPEAGEGEGRRREMGGCGVPEITGKRLEKMKKHLIGKINNMDIVIADPPAHPQQSPSLSDDRTSSIMSAKLAHYEP